jgi:hypothetical protein
MRTKILIVKYSIDLKFTEQFIEMEELKIEIFTSPRKEYKRHTTPKNIKAA